MNSRSFCIFTRNTREDSCSVNKKRETSIEDLLKKIYNSKRFSLRPNVVRNISFDLKLTTNLLQKEAKMECKYPWCLNKYRSPKYVLQYYVIILRSTIASTRCNDNTKEVLWWLVESLGKGRSRVCR